MARFLLALLCVCFITAAGHAQWSNQIPPGDVPVYVPTDYDPDVAMPLVIFLHGYSPLTTAWYDILIPLQEDANERGYIFAKPDGSQDGLGEYYWDATEACCDMWGNEPDHVGYLLALIDAIEANYNIDPDRIHLVGHSNGGFMCHRMACEASDRLASVVSIAGAMWNNESNCQPTDPVHVLEIHGTLDFVILWGGGYIILTPYPGAETTAEYWATHNGCETSPTNVGTLDLNGLISGAETTRWQYGGCDDSSAGSAALWEISSGLHFPIFTDDGVEALFDYLDTHGRPSADCPGDINGDLVVNTADFSEFLVQFGQTGEGLSADLDGDQDVDIDDFSEFLINFGNKCSAPLRAAPTGGRKKAHT